MGTAHEVICSVGAILTRYSVPEWIVPVTQVILPTSRLTGMGPIWEYY